MSGAAGIPAIHGGEEVNQPHGSSQPHRSVMNRCRHSISTRSWSSMTAAEVDWRCIRST
jgi:hypothetical protein